MDKQPAIEQTLATLCEQHNVPQEMLEEMLEIEKEKSTMLRRHGIYEDLRDLLLEYAPRNYQPSSVKNAEVTNDLT